MEQIASRENKLSLSDSEGIKHPQEEITGLARQYIGNIKIAIKSHFRNT